jgi:hypothetical protein
MTNDVPPIGKDLPRELNLFVEINGEESLPAAVENNELTYISGHRLFKARFDWADVKPIEFDDYFWWEIPATKLVEV